MVRLAQKYESHTVSVSGSYFSNVSGPAQAQYTDRGNLRVGLGGTVWGDEYLRWQGAGYAQADNGTDWTVPFGTPTNFSMGRRKWALEGKSVGFDVVYEYKFTPVYAQPEDGETIDLVYSAKATTPVLPLLYGSSAPGNAGFTCIAGDASFVAFMARGAQPYMEYDFWPHMMVTISIDGSADARYAFTEDFNGQIPVQSVTDQVMRYKGGNVYEFYTSAFDDSLGAARQRWLYTIEPTNVKPSPADYSREKIELSDAADNTLFNDTVSPPWYAPGASAWQGWIVTQNPYGFLVTVDKLIGGVRQRKFWQFSEDWDRYREIIFNPLDELATTSLALASQTTGFANMDDSGNIVYVPQGGTPFNMAWFYILGGPESAIPVWDNITGDSTIRAWPLSLDDHDFYVLRLGLEETIVYDATTQQWSQWASQSNKIWAVNTGFAWEGGTGKSDTNVVVLDDTTGNLYWLDTNEAYDEAQTADLPAQYFTRYATTYQVARGRDVKPCFGVTLSCDMQGDGARSAELLYSDDGGVNFESAGVETGTAGHDANEFAWRSLGQMSAPGRVYRLKDDGVAARLDSLEVDNGE